MKKSLTRSALSVAALSALLLASCSSTPSAESEPETSDTDSAAQDQEAEDTEVTAGGVATVAIDADPGTMDPTIANTFAARMVFTSMCEKLYDADENLEVVPQLASDLPEISEDGLTVTIPLRDDVLFNDGTPFNAEAVKISLDRHREHELSARKQELASVDSVEVLDDHTVELKLTQPFSPLAAQLADRAGAIMSPAALDEWGDDFGQHPICVGPFTFDDQIAGSEISLVKSEYYYDADLVNLDGVKYQFIADANVRSANLKSGDIQAATRLNPSDLPDLEANPDITVDDAATIAYQAISINVDPEKSDSPLATNPELRRALELSIDRDALNQVVFNGTNVPDCTPHPMQTIFRPDSVECPPYDPEQSKEILAAEGIDGELTVKFMHPARPMDQKLAEVIQQMAREGGFNLELVPMEFLSSLDAARAGDFEMFIIGWSGRIDPDGNFNDLVTTGGSNNFSQVSDEQLDKLIKEGAETNDPEERKDLYAQALDRIDELKPNIYLYHDTWFLGTSGVDGIVYNSDALPRFKEAYIK